MVRGLLFSQFSPATSAAVAPLVIAAPALGQTAQINNASAKPIENAANRTMSHSSRIVPRSVASALVIQRLDVPTVGLVAGCKVRSAKRFQRGESSRLDAELN